MNPILRGFGPNRTNKLWHSTQTNQRSLSNLIQQVPILLKKMNNFQQFNTPAAHFSDNASSRYRFWRQISNVNQHSDMPGLTFKIVSYNILSQDLLMQHLYLYRHSHHLHLKWSYRLERLTEQIIAHKPDILCLQEVQENQLKEIMDVINTKMPSMLSLFKKKTGPKSDGCAIIYNAQRFDLILSDGVEFFRPDIQLLDRHNIALIAKFRCKTKRKAKFVVSTTHLLFNPKRQDVRLAQIMFLLAELDRHSKRKPGKLNRIPVILTGDFNFQARSAPYELLTTGKLCYEGLAKKSLTAAYGMYDSPTGKRFITDKLRITDNCQHFDCVASNYKDSPKQNLAVDSKYAHLFATGTLTHNLRLSSVYDHFEGVSYGSIFQDGWVTVDHLFYTKEDRPSKYTTLQLLSVFQLPTVQQCRQIGNLPNEVHGSDHLLVGACFRLNFGTETSQ